MLPLKSSRNKFYVLSKLSMSQINFAIIFIFGLAMVYFSLGNNEPTTVKLYPGVAFQMPLAALLLIAGGLGALFAWTFAAWNGIDFTQGMSA